MPNINRNTQGGTSVSSGSLAPRTNRTGTGQIHSNWVGTSALDTPVLSAATSISGGFTFTITNYSALNTYVLSTTAGSASQTSGTVTQSGLGYSTSATVSVTATRSGFVTSATETRAGTSNAAPPCVPAGCTPPCGTATFSGATTCGGSVIGCYMPGCYGGCRRWALDCYTYSQQSCVDNCGITYYNTCASFCVDSTVSSACC